MGIPDIVDESEIGIKMPEYLRIKSYGINGESK
jgi:hypothetical protein